MRLLSDAKDRVIERAALAYLNSALLARYGRATSLTINSTEGTVGMEIELNGETAPVKIHIHDYELTEEAGRYFAVVKGIGTSREWLTALAQDQLCNRRFEIGSTAGRLLIGVL